MREARAALETAVKLDPMTIGAQLQLSSLHLGAGGPVEARRYAMSVLTIDPNNAAAKLALGRALVALGNLPDAEAQAQALLSQYPAGPKCTRSPVRS